jgi:hypothetical protein
MFLTRVLALACLASISTFAISPTFVFADDTATADAKTADPEKADAPTATVTVFNSGTLVVPSVFKEARKANNIIDHEFAATVGEGDDAKTARLTLMSATGGVKANVDRWIGQFSGDDRKTSETTQTDSNGWEVYVVEISGDFAERMGGGPFAGGKVVRRENYGMIGAILIEPEDDTPGRGQYFVKLIGPKEVITAHADAFKKMVNAVGE